MSKTSKASKKKKSPLARFAGRYRVVKALGQGGSGVVYLVQDSQEGDRLKALKVVADKAQESAMLDDLKNEFSTLSLLHHSHLAEVYDFETNEEEKYFTSEWVDGQDVLTATARADLNSVFQIFVQVLRALDYLHQRGVLHLDLKPANILVTDPNRTGALSAKLIDFGIAQWKKRGLSHSEGFSGTPPYAAPELLQEQAPSPSSDIYSLGMIFHLIFAKQFPFSTQDPIEIMMRQVYENPRRMERLDPALPAQFADLLLRMVAREPTQRFASAREVLEALNRCLGENFSLRSPKAPAHILEESDHIFHPEILNALNAFCHAGKPFRLNGPPGAGKRWLSMRLKVVLQLQGKTGFLDPKIMEASGPELEVPPLDTEKLSRFFAAEILQAPQELSTTLLQTQAPLFPGHLEKILQAMREEGLLAWGYGGWIWYGDAQPDVKALLQRKASRDQLKKQELQHFLEVSGLTLPAVVLEGMLGLETGAMWDDFEQWLGEGWLRREFKNGVAYYSACTTRAPDAAEFGADSDVAIQSLNRLYEQGRFGAGSAWLQQSLDRVAPQTVAPRLALIGARHWVAEGQADRALHLLESLSFSDLESRGLLFETRARAHNILGRVEDAEVALAQSETAYSAAGNVRGLARVDHLRGLLFRARRLWREAEEYLQKAVREAKQAGDLYCAGLAQCNFALVRQEQGDFEAAYLGYQQAWELARQEPHPFLLQSLYQKWIHLLHHTGRSAEAETACYEWMKLAIRHGYRDQQAIALNYLSLIAGRKGHVQLKSAYLDQAIALVDGKKQPRFLAQFLINRAYLHWSLKKFLPAQLDAEAALEIARHWKEDRLLGWIFLIMGKIYRDRSHPDWEKSAEYFKCAHANIVKNQTHESLWELQYNRGLLSKLMGEAAAAEQYFIAAKQALQGFIEKLPEPLRASYLRDRKLEAVSQELAEDLDNLLGVS